MPFIPKNAKAILQSAKLQKQFFLNPYGLKVKYLLKNNFINTQTPTNYKYPKPQVVKKFLDLDIKLHRPGKDVNQNVLTFKCNQNYSKPQLKQYLSKLYNLNIQKVNTARFMGTVYKSMDNKPKKAKNWKKVFALTTHKFDPFLNSQV